jgi:predicted RNA-binding protein associated with RNAse of E/G family
MKQIILIATMLLTFGAVNAQIAEVKQDGGIAKIYNDQGSFTGYYVSLCSSCELTGYNAKYIVVTDGSLAKIYDAKGNYTGYYVSLCSSCYIINVSATAILVKDGGLTKYYDFKGNYTGNFTSN